MAPKSYETPLGPQSDDLKTWFLYRVAYFCKPIDFFAVDKISLFFDRLAQGWVEIWNNWGQNGAINIKFYICDKKMPDVANSCKKRTGKDIEKIQVG